MNVGILHPGEMGISIAASAKNSGHAVYWASEGRGEKTRSRAEKHALIDAGTVKELCRVCQFVLCICPPDAAEAVAHQVIDAGYKGIYLDANAISPDRSRSINKRMQVSGIQYVDGGIIGGPALEPKNTWLYLSGEKACGIAACFSQGPLEVKVIGDEIGKASALKMCYAAYTKGTIALLCAVLATASALHVDEELFHQWELDEAGSAEQAARRARYVTAKAWRFAGEMEEIAATFASAGLPSGFHESAAEIYRRMQGFKDSTSLPELPKLNEVLASLQRKKHPAN
ncbi:MAG TPA: NAD(P)-dependent oxidoreductase [Syntrophobacteraceae bacterium]|nr:NAD(P)-dependent oxidoreductase [Syntrophobacteraceae bacterium]